MFVEFSVFDILGCAIKKSNQIDNFRLGQQAFIYLVKMTRKKSYYSTFSFFL